MLACWFCSVAHEILLLNGCAARYTDAPDCFHRVSSSFALVLPKTFPFNVRSVARVPVRSTRCPSSDGGSGEQVSNDTRTGVCRVVCVQSWLRVAKVLVATSLASSRCSPQDLCVLGLVRECLPADVKAPAKVHTLVSLSIPGVKFMSISHVSKHGPRSIACVQV